MAEKWTAERHAEVKARVEQFAGWEEDLSDALDRIEELEAEVARLREGFNEAIRRPMGVVPAGYEDLTDQK